MLKKVVVRYAHFMWFNRFMKDGEVRILDALDPCAVRWPDSGGHSFTLNERVDVVDGHDTFVGKSRQVGPTYFHPAGKVSTLAEIEALDRHDLKKQSFLSIMAVAKTDAVIDVNGFMTSFNSKTMAVCPASPGNHPPLASLYDKSGAFDRGSIGDSSSLEELLLALAKFGNPRLTHAAKGWYCKIYTELGVDSKLASDFGLDTPTLAARQCFERLDKALPKKTALVRDEAVCLAASGE